MTGYVEIVQIENVRSRAVILFQIDELCLSQEDATKRHT